ncbi:hypothetical protein [Streptomyces sp. KAU_LT]|uniref:hypothetical protein n=1 Tax=Streptomyces sp. KAU_LT TaxID=3046669 RepID=UPI0024B6FD2A|nr:hypothetical protein [Streptomyces sp. KAU_LT]MDI9836245.1 hypothetical protein [Streptomyces sp. KAU_LT]
MSREGGVYVCGKCGSSWDPGVQPQRLVAMGLIARRTRGRSLRLVCTAAGVTGHLRRRTPALVGGCR